MKKRSWLLWLPVVLLGYLGLLALLAAVEKGHPDASIQSFADALWYSIVTLSTVGYGDLYPVTVAGKVIGVLFVLLSVGALAFLVGAAVNFFTGQMLPRLQLQLLWRKKWFVFSQMNDASLALARSLKGEKGVLLFPQEARDQAPEDLQLCYYPGTMASILKGKTQDCALFFLDEESGSNYAQALAALPMGHPVYCRTEQTPDLCPEGLTLFDRYDCCARDYWRRHPLTSGENRLVFIGDGQYAWELLEQGLAVNVFGRERTITYHTFGNWEEFCRCHPQLGMTVAVNEEKFGQDRLYFAGENWDSDGSILENAHRIIICGDDEGENLAILRKLRRYFPTVGTVHLRNKAAIPGELVFGMDQTVFTAENVMASQLMEVARTMHSIYRESSGGNAPLWQELDGFTKRSNVAAADHLLVKIRLLLEAEDITEITAEHCKKAYLAFASQEDRTRFRWMEHQRWMRFLSLNNWRRGGKRNNALRIHPMLVPFEDLSPEEQAKDDYAWKLLGAISQKLEEKKEDI